MAERLKKQILKKDVNIDEVSTEILTRLDKIIKLLEEIEKKSGKEKK